MFTVDSVNKSDKPNETTGDKYYIIIIVKHFHDLFSIVMKCGLSLVHYLNPA